MTIAQSASVTAIVTTYNEGVLLETALASVAAQTLQPSQIVVVDDGSPEPSAEGIVRGFEARTGCRVRFERTDNRGPSAARNTALGLAEHELVAYLDADDYWLPNHLARGVAQLLKLGRRYSTSYASHHVAYAPGAKPREQRVFADYQGPFLVERIGALGGIPSGSPFLVHRRAALLEVGGFDETLRINEDLDLMLRLAKLGHWVAGTSEPTVVRLIRPASSSRRNTRALVSRIDEFLDKAQAQALLSDASIRRRRKLVRLQVGKRLLIEGAPPQEIVGVFQDAFSFAAPDGRRERLLAAAVTSRWIEPALELAYRVRR